MVKLRTSPQIILRTAFDVKSYKNKKNSPVSDNISRAKQYVDGSRAFQEFLPNYREFDLTIIDNTVSSPEGIPVKFRNLWSDTKIVCTGTNRFGRHNKGAGDVETLKFAFKHGIIKRDFLFYELRIKTISSDFIVSYLNSPRNLISLEKDMLSAKSGYIGFEFATAVKFYNSVSPISLVIRKTSIENVLFNYWRSNSFEFFPYGNYALRFDPWKGDYISY